MTPAQLELAVLSKPYFAEDEFLILESDQGDVAGFLHLGPVGDPQSGDVDATSLGVYALCLDPTVTGEADANQLTQLIRDRLEQGEYAKALFRPEQTKTGFYLGCGPGDSVAGVLSTEVQVCNWLARSGFVAQTQTRLWELDLSQFQPPVDRVQLQIRRNCLVQQLDSDPPLSWWAACSRGHAEPHGFQLLDRKNRRVLEQVIVWSLPFELMSDPMQVAWVWPEFEWSNEGAADRITFLIGESARSIADLGVQALRIVSRSMDEELTNVIHRLGFQPIESGMLFELPK